MRKLVILSLDFDEGGRSFVLRNFDSILIATDSFVKFVVRVCGRNLLDCSGLLLEIAVDCLDCCGRGFCWILWIVLLLFCSPFAVKILILFLCCCALLI